MKDTRRTRTWTLVAVTALALGAGVASTALSARRAPRIAVETDLRDAVAAPVTAPPIAALAGRPVPTVWFKAPSSRAAELDARLLSSRRARANARRVAVQ